MKSAFFKKTMAIFILLTATMVAAQSKGKKHDDYITVKKAQLESATNHGESAGRKLGKQEGYKEGYQEGHVEGEKAGYEAGFDAGRAWIADSILRVVHDIEMNGIAPTECGKLYDIVRSEFHDLSVWREDLKQRYYHEGEKEGYEVGFREALALKFDTLYRLQLWQGQQINFPEKAKNYPFSLDYENIARLLGTMNGRDAYVEKAFFNDALYEVNSTMLEFLTGVIDLSLKEKAEVFQRYGEIHNPLADRCYEQYKQLCQTINRNYNKDFYNYQYSISTEAFLDVVLFNLVAVADVTFTYAKSNSQYAAWMGFEMGSVNQVLLDRVVVPLSDYFRKNSIRLDYETHFPQLIPVTVSLLSPIVAETRTHTKTIYEDIVLSNDHVVTVKMKINTTIQVGYFLEDFSITADHRKQNVWVSLSNRPRMISLVQDYKVVDVFSQVNFRGRCSFTTELDEGKLEAIFRKHLDRVEALDIYSAPLQKSAVNIVAPVLVKTLEPSIAIPYSCYKVKLDFGGKVSDLITIKCR